MSALEVLQNAYYHALHNVIFVDFKKKRVKLNATKKWRRNNQK